MTFLNLNPRLLQEAASNLQIVAVDSFYDLPDDELANEWLGKLFRFKVNSYRESYPYGISPFGATDLFGNHWIVADKTDHGLTPIMAFKTVSSRRCQTFRTDFPALGLVCDPGAELHRAAIEYELRKADREKYDVGYVGSWTIDPKLRSDARMSSLCKTLTSALVAKWVEEYDIQVALTFAILKYKVDKFHAYLGMSPLCGPNGEELSSITPSPTFGEATRISVLQKDSRSEASIQDMKNIQELWDNRISIVGDQSALTASKRAA